MNLTKLKIGDLKIATYNPRKELNEKDKEYQKIKNSILEFGYVAPIIVNKDMTVISGHQRIKVLKDLSYEEIECIVVDFDKNKEKLLPFIKYCLSCDVQKNMSEECMYLPVNSDAMEKCIDSIDEAIDFGDLIVSDKEKAIVETAQSAAIRDYKYIINNITKCNLYGFNYLSDTYFNSSVISDIVDKYLNGDISNEKFIRQLTAATEIYLKECNRKLTEIFLCMRDIRG